MVVVHMLVGSNIDGNSQQYIDFDVVLDTVVVVIGTG